MKNFKKIEGISELTFFESISIDGGNVTPDSDSSFWHDVAWLAGAIVKGAVIFATEGGRNAGLCVR